MSVYERLEEAGHDLVLVNGLQLGVSTYACENCGALIKLRNDEVILFHVPASSTATELKCVGPKPRAFGVTTLREKLAKLNDEDMERFRQSMED
jgi:hypothetical protein